MSDDEADRKEQEPGPSPPGGPPTISLSQLWRSIKEQPLLEKLLFWGGLVYVCATFLDWSGATGFYLLGWDTGALSVLAHLIMLAGLLVQIGGLAGFGPGGTSPQWLRVYRYAAIGPPLVLVLTLVRGYRGLGAWLALLALAVNLYALYRILDAKKLLPVRFTR